jgi:hypothetical protein
MSAPPCADEIAHRADARQVGQVVGGPGRAHVVVGGSRRDPLQDGLESVRLPLRHVRPFYAKSISCINVAR